MSTALLILLSFAGGYWFRASWVESARLDRASAMKGETTRRRP